MYTRATLLDKTLTSLERDWPQFRSGWFSRFHGELDPTVSEMRLHARRYLALCHSRIPPTVTFALGMVQKLDDDAPFAAADLLDALRPVMSAGVKAQVLAALKLLDRLEQRDPAATAQLASLAAVGLSHEAADVQKQVLARLAKWGVGELLRATLADRLPGVAAVNRKALETLSGKSASESGVAPPLATTTAKVGALDAGRRLPAIDDPGELVERIAYVFENDTDIDEFERVIAALVRLAPLSTDLRARLGPVAKRAAKVKKPIAFELARLLHFVLDGARQPSAPRVSSRDGRTGLAERYLIDRVNGLMDVAALARE